MFMCDSLFTHKPKAWRFFTLSTLHDALPFFRFMVLTMKEDLYHLMLQLKKCSYYEKINILISKYCINA